MVMNSQSLSKEQVLIVGCGDIGRRLAQCLSQDNYEVTGLRRNPPVDLPFLRYQACDVTNASEFGEVLRQDFAVIVISMTPSERSDAGYQRAYLQTCINLVDELRTQSLKPRLLIFVSSSAVYAQMDGSWVDENSVTEPDGFSGKRLLEAEAIIQSSGYTNTIVRFSGIYGPDRNRLIEQVRQRKASSSLHFTNRIHADDCARSLSHLIEISRTSFNFTNRIHADDSARSLFPLIELNRNGQPLQSVYLATDSTPAPLLEVVSWLAEQMGVKDFLSDEATNERGNKRCSNQRLLDSGFVFRYPAFKEGYAAVLAHIND